MTIYSILAIIVATFLLFSLNVYAMGEINKMSDAEFFSRARELAAVDLCEDFRMLIENDPYVRIEKETWWSVVHIATLSTDHNCMKYASRGMNIEARDIDGLTPLHYAVNGNNIGVANYILKRGCTYRKDNFGKTAMDYAERRGGDMLFLLKYYKTGMDYELGNLYEAL